MEKTEKEPNVMCALLQLGQVEVQRDSGSGDAETREQLIKNHFTQRINDMTLQLQLADSKAVNFHAEVSLFLLPPPPPAFSPPHFCVCTHMHAHSTTQHTQTTHTHTHKKLSTQYYFTLCTQKKTNDKY